MIGFNTNLYCINAPVAVAGRTVTVDVDCPPEYSKRRGSGAHHVTRPAHHLIASQCSCDSLSLCNRTGRRERGGDELHDAGLPAQRTKSRYLTEMLAPRAPRVAALTVTTPPAPARPTCAQQSSKTRRERSLTGCQSESNPAARRAPSSFPGRCAGIMMPFTRFRDGLQGAPFDQTSRCLSFLALWWPRYT